jgi:double-stranded uracil-DNA glycosylase
MGFTREVLEAHRDTEVPDLRGRRVRLAFVGINPSLTTAATGTHFAHPGNRFYPALHRAGITTRPLPRGVTHDAADRAQLTERGIAITNVAARATARADELSREELRDGAVRLVERLRAWSPRVVAFAGVSAYRLAFDRPHALIGPQVEGLAGATLWVVPNPSGLNAHETVDSLAERYRRVAAAAGVL